MKNKKIVTIIAGVLAFVIAFVGGFALSGGFSKKGNEDSQSQSETKFDFSNEILGEGTVEISLPELRYYGMLIYDNLFNQAMQYDYYYGEGSGLSVTGFDWTKSPQYQSYSGEIDGVENPTYMDYIVDAAITQLHTIKAYVEYAKINGITLTDEELKEISDYIENGRTTAEASGVTFDEYLVENFGEGFTVELFEKLVTEQYIVNRVDLLKNEAYTDSYTEEDAQKIYDENLTSYGVVTVRNYMIAAEQVMNQDGTSGSVTDKTMEDAEKKANDFISKVTDEESFKNFAAEYEKEAGNEKYEEMKTEDSLTLVEDISFEVLDYETSDENFAPWAFSTERQKGDTYVALIDGVGYCACMIVEPVHKVKTQYTYDVRHIFIDPSSTPKEGAVGMMDTSEYDANIDIDVNLENTASIPAYLRAQEILIEYLEGDRTEDSFSDLAILNSGDTNAAQGGIYEDVAEGSMVAEFENWALEEGRQYGDVGIVETTYGYHVMYFIGKEKVSDWLSVIIDDCVFNDIRNFSYDLIDRYKTDVSEEIIQNTVDTINALAEESIPLAKQYFEQQQQ